MQEKSMTAGQLKTAIAEDIETLKNLDLDIMPSSFYYGEVRKLFAYIYLKMLGTVLFAFFFPFIYRWDLLLEFIRNNLFSNICNLLLPCAGGCLFAFLFIFKGLNDYIIIKNQLENKLKTGKLIVEQMQRAAKINYSLFALITFIPPLFTSPSAALISAAVGAIISSILTSILVEMEIKRIGISLLFKVVGDFFDKDKNKDVNQSVYPPKRYD